VVLVTLSSALLADELTVDKVVELAKAHAAQDFEKTIGYQTSYVGYGIFATSPESMKSKLITMSLILGYFAAPPKITFPPERKVFIIESTTDAHLRELYENVYMQEIELLMKTTIEKYAPFSIVFWLLIAFSIYLSTL